MSIRRKYRTEMDRGENEGPAKRGKRSRSSTGKRNAEEEEGKEFVKGSGRGSSAQRGRGGRRRDGGHRNAEMKRRRREEHERQLAEEAKLNDVAARGEEVADPGTRKKKGPGKHDSQKKKGSQAEQAIPAPTSGQSNKAAKKNKKKKKGGENPSPLQGKAARDDRAGEHEYKKEAGGEGERPKKKSRRKGNSRRTRVFYKPHITEEEARAGLESGRFVLGELRVNAHNRSEAYCTVEVRGREPV